MVIYKTRIVFVYLLKYFLNFFIVGLLLIYKWIAYIFYKNCQKIPMTCKLLPRWQKFAESDHTDRCPIQSRCLCVSVMQQWTMLIIVFGFFATWRDWFISAAVATDKMSKSRGLMIVFSSQRQLCKNIDLIR